MEKTNLVKVKSVNFELKLIRPTVNIVESASK